MRFPDGRWSLFMTISKPDDDQFQQIEQPASEPSEPQGGPGGPTESQGFWQQPTEPMEREHQPFQQRSQKDRE